MLCIKQGVKPAHVINESGIYRTHGHQIFNGSRKPTRDKVVQLAFGFKMDLNETNDLLKWAKRSALYARVERDSVIIHALMNKHKFQQVQETLYEMGLPILGDRDK